MKKNQHLIPVFYQKLFSSNTNGIGKYLIADESFIPCASIKTNGSEAFYYGECDEIENYFVEIEGNACSIIKSIIERGVAPARGSYEHEMILLFLVTFEARVRKTGESANDLFELMSKQIITMKRDHGQINIDDDTINRLNVKLKVPNYAAIKAATEIYGILRDLRCCLIRSDVSQCFITSDNPVIRYNYYYTYRKYYGRNYGLGNMGAQIILPISPKLCLYVYDDVLYNSKPLQDGNFHFKTNRDVDMLNLLTYMNSYDYLLFDNQVNEKYIKKLIKGQKNLRSACVNNWVMGTPESKIIAHGVSCVKKKFTFPMFQVRSEFNNMPMPAHMGGPMRPIAKEFQRVNGD